MEIRQKVYIIDRNQRSYNNHKLIEEKMICEAEVTKESTQSYFIKIRGREYRYSKKSQSLVSNSSQELYGIQSKVFLTRDEALLDLKPKVEENKKTAEVNKKYTLIKCKDGSEVKLEHKYLDQDFIDDAIEWGKKNNAHPQCNASSGFFTARAIEKYIEETSTQPIYE